MGDTVAHVQALVLHGAQDLRLESRPQPALAEGEVSIQIKATGLCGSDLHYYNHGRNGAFVLQSPLVLGHEASGIIRQSNTPSLPPNTRVALEVGLPCRTCSLCTRGRYNLCPNLRFKSSAKTFPHADGTLQSVISHPADMCHILPDSVSFDQGALVEPLAVSLHAINRSQGDVPFAGSTALVLGAGAVGMLTAAALSVSGVSQIFVADIDEPRLKIVSEIGGGRFNIKTFLLPRKPPGKDIEETLNSAQMLARDVCIAAGLGGFDRVFECTGVPSCVQLGIYAASPGSKLVLVGMGTPVQTLPLGAAALREVDIVGVFRYANCYPAAIALFASGKLDGVVEALVTHHVPLHDGEKAFRLAANRAKPGEDEGRVAVKVVLTS
jgi:L-iditol 2-dehydrogenase